MDGRSDVAFLRTATGGTAKLYRFLSTGTSFSAPTVTFNATYDTTKLGNRLGVGDVGGDRVDDVVFGYQLDDGNFDLHVLNKAYSGPGQQWYRSTTPLNLTSNVGGRFVVGRW